MDTPITLRPDRRTGPRREHFLLTPPLTLLSLANKPALLADLRAAVTAASSDPRAVSLLFNGIRMDLLYAEGLCRSMAERIEQSQELKAVSSGVLDACNCGALGCLPAKQVQE